MTNCSNPQMFAVNIEHVLCDVFECERFGFGGIVNSDFIRKQPFTAISCGLSFIYANAGTKKRATIEKFIEDYSFYSDMSIDDLLSFETSQKTINGITIELNFKNGEEAIESMINDFREVCK